MLLENKSILIPLNPALKALDSFQTTIIIAEKVSEEGCTEQCESCQKYCPASEECMATDENVRCTECEYLCKTCGQCELKK